jgi:hypothetical protein
VHEILIPIRSRPYRLICCVCNDFGLWEMQAEKYKLCGMIDFQRHMLCECRGSPIMSGLREKAKMPNQLY